MSWLEGLITFLQVAAILSGASFAALALFTDYKKDGKVTRYGRMSVIGIALSALCSLGTQWAQAKLTDERGKAAATAAEGQRKQEADRFNTQIGRLDDVATSLGLLNGANQKLSRRAEESLRQLAAVQARVGQSLFATRQIGQQNRRNTTRMLATMWADANRISASGLAVDVNYSCGNADRAPPRLMDDGATMTVHVARLNDRQRAGLSPTAFHTESLLGDAATTFRSNEQRITVTNVVTSAGANVNQRSQFTAFQTFDIGPFSEPGSWRGAVVEIVIVAYRTALVRDAAAAFGDEPRGSGEMARLYDMSRFPIGEDDSLSMLSCPVHMTLLVNGRLVATAEARVVQVSKGDDNSRGLVVVKFPIVRVTDSAFLVFGS